MPGKDHGPSIKKGDEYDALKKKGMSKSKAAAISNADAKGFGKNKGSQAASKKGGKTPPGKGRKTR